MNSDVPHSSNLVSELHRNYLFQFKFCLQFDQTGTCRHMMAPLCERITNLFGSTPAANMVKSYSFNPLSTMITTIFQEKSNKSQISEPIMRRFFPQNLSHVVPIGAVSSIHSAFERNAATLRKVWRLFRSVMWPILFPFLSLFLFCFLSFLVS